MPHCCKTAAWRVVASRRYQEHTQHHIMLSCGWRRRELGGWTVPRGSLLDSMASKNHLIRQMAAFVYRVPEHLFPSLFSLSRALFKSCQPTHTVQADEFLPLLACFRCRFQSTSNSSWYPWLSRSRLETAPSSAKGRPGTRASPAAARCHAGLFHSPVHCLESTSRSAEGRAVVLQQTPATRTIAFFKNDKLPPSSLMMRAAIAVAAALVLRSVGASTMTAASPIQITLTPATSIDLPNLTGILMPRVAVSNSIAFDGRVSYDFLGERFNFTMIQNRGYVTVESLTTRELLRNDCLRRANVPPVVAFLESLRAARVLDDDQARDVKSVTCSDGRLIEFSFGPEVYVFCSHANHAIARVNGQDIDGVLQLLQDNTVDTPDLAAFVRPQGKTLEECEALSAEETPSRVLTRRAAEVAKDCSTSCRNGTRICLFVHGLGETLDAELADEYREYWGHVTKQLHCCSQTKFMRMDTVNNAWYDGVLSKKVCDAAVSLTGSKNAMELENIAIIAHSMGNLIMANAAMKKLCAVGPTSKWIALSGPMSGSQSANLGVNVCKYRTAVSDHVVMGRLVRVLDKLRICPARKALSSLVFEHSNSSWPQLDSLYDQADAAFAKHVSSVMCGVSERGLVTREAARYWVLGLASPHRELSDGAVAFSSCRGLIPETAFTMSWDGGNFYKAALNHGDVTLRNGDGFWGNDRMPVKWLNCQL